MNLSLITLIICPALCVIMFLYLKWYVKNRTSPSGVLKETRIEVQNWIKEVTLTITEINSVTDRNLQLIEDKIEQLNRIMDDTDKRISVYVKEVEKSKASEALYTQLGRGVRAAVKIEQPPQNNAVKLSAIYPELPAQSAAGSVPVNPPKKEQKPQAMGISKKQIRKEIDKLAEDGLTAEKIASQLGISIAEVELAMQLRR